MEGQPKQLRSQRTLEKILDTSVRLIRDRSFEQISMQDIAGATVASWLVPVWIWGAVRVWVDVLTRFSAAQMLPHRPESRVPGEFSEASGRRGNRSGHRLLDFS